MILTGILWSFLHGKFLSTHSTQGWIQSVVLVSSQAKLTMRSPRDLTLCNQTNPVVIKTSLILAGFLSSTSSWYWIHSRSRVIRPCGSVPAPPSVDCEISFVCGVCNMSVGVLSWKLQFGILHLVPLIQSVTGCDLFSNVTNLKILVMQCRIYSVGCFSTNIINMESPSLSVSALISITRSLRWAVSFDQSLCVGWLLQTFSSRLNHNRLDSPSASCLSHWIAFRSHLPIIVWQTECEQKQNNYFNGEESSTPTSELAEFQTTLTGRFKYANLWTCKVPEPLCTLPTFSRKPPYTLPSREL